MPFDRQPIANFLYYVTLEVRATQPDSSSPDPGSRLVPSQISMGPPILKPNKMTLKIKGPWDIPPASLKGTDVSLLLLFTY